MICYTRKHKIAFYIDDEDWNLVSQFTWCDSDGYICTGFEGMPLMLHNLLLGPTPKGLECDHKNRCKVDNRRRNLRFVTKSVNRRNVGVRADSKTGVTGVSRVRGTNRWVAYIHRRGKLRWLGSFSSLEAATQARLYAEKLKLD